MCVGGAISICYLSIYIYTYAYRDTNICACVIYVNVYTSYIYKTIYTYFLNNSDWYMESDQYVLAILIKFG